MAINQLTTANTFQQWLVATQSLITVANNLTEGSGGTFYANTDIVIDGDLTVTGNITLDAVGYDDLTVAGNASIGGTISVTGNATVGNLVTTTANITSLVGTSNTNIYSAIAAASGDAVSPACSSENGIRCRLSAGCVCDDSESTRGFSGL